MNGHSERFAGLGPSQVRRLTRSLLVTVAVLAAVAVAGAGAFGYLVLGLGVAVGLLLGAANSLALQLAAAKAAGAEQTSKKPLVASSVRRLGAVTVAVIALWLADRQLGIGALIGLGACQFVMVAISSRMMLSALKQEGAK